MDEDKTRRPDGMDRAVVLLYVTLGIGVLRSILEASRLAQGASLGFVVFIPLAVLCIGWFFIHMIGRGKNWARIVFLILFIVGLPFSLLPLMRSLAASPFSGVLGVGQVVVQIVALVLLFQKQSSDWFKHMASLKQLPKSDRINC